MTRSFRRRRISWQLCQRTAALVLALSIAGSPLGSAHAQLRRVVPNDAYLLSFRPHYEGDYRSSLRGFRNAARSGLRNVEGRWIDSICYHTMVGECHYQMGDLSSALEQYDAALKLFLVHKDWMKRVQFPQAVMPSNSNVRNTITWSAGPRASALGDFPDTIPILLGSVQNEIFIWQGKPIQTSQLYPIRVHEIARCTALALRRRTELLGPACAHDPLSTQLMQALATRPGPINHWSEPWIRVQLGLAYASAGRPTEAAAELQSSLLIAGQFDHPLTATAQLELGKLALKQGQHQVASTLFLDATLSAAEFDQADLAEEAFRYGLAAHLAGGAQTVYPPLAPAAEWARRKDFEQLHASLLIMAAENQSVLGQIDQAGQLLTLARRAVGRRSMMTGQVGVRLQYMAAQIAFQNGDMDTGRAALLSAMNFQRASSRWLFQIVMADRLYTSGTVTPRTADVIYTDVLREPTSADWVTDPMESLSTVVIPHGEALEHWLEVAIERKEPERAVEIADRIRRHRFFSTLPMGGRLVALRWILEAPDAALSQAARLQRTDLRVKYPKYAELSKQSQTLRRELAGLPANGADPDFARQSKLMKQLDSVTAAQERLLHEIAVRREPTEFVFPPQYSTPEIQKALDKDELALVYLATSQTIHAFMLSRDNYAHWRIAPPSKTAQQVSAVLRTLGQIDNNRPVPIKLLQDPRWREFTRLLLERLIEERQHGFWNRFQRLVIVPDGVLWHVPFDALQIPEGEGTQPLIAKTRIRYLPTASLIVPDGRGQPRLTSTEVVLGRLHPGDDPEVASNAFEVLQTNLPGVRTLTPPLPGPTGLYRCVWDRLVVLDDIEDYGSGPYAWSPAQLDSGKPGSDLGRWLMLPWGGPEQIVLPGFRTSAASSLRKEDGGDLFLSVCGLMASGARTILISRWRTGGKTGIDLVREFTQELPRGGNAVDAWYRSVQLVRSSEIDPQSEPRVSSSPKDGPLAGEHPFFWSGYLLIDSAGQSQNQQ